ncbi:hypothetical protein GIB67_027388 [Kingdonia uniflora]|uniref:ubiquitinyl hydrolase 1 n=1 Tax=Kingdonia uniflora TaxID=39325 RepID=A0A7J7MF72_9MAGN|nr:hypothetical protein GIB67_027388 [Kingdonia uniflora]
MSNEEVIIKTIYHEKQILQLCLLHALNNLFQEKNLFTRADLNALSEQLVLADPIKQHWTRAPLSVIFKPHHNALSGNYDINVLIAALEGKGKEVVWHDRRNGADTIHLDHESQDMLMGIVLNIPVKRFIGIWKGRHWVTLRIIEGVWYNLDSDLLHPYSFKDTREVKDFIDYIIRSGGEAFLVFHKNGDKDQEASQA